MTRAIIYLMAIGVISVCAILLPELAREEAVGKANPPVVYPFLLGAWALSIPIFAALHQALKLVEYVEKNIAFSVRSVKALQNIKISAVVFSVMVIAGALTVLLVARSTSPSEDGAPVATIGFIFIFISSGIATFAAVLQRLLHDAIKIKSENDSII